MKAIDNNQNNNQNYVPYTKNFQVVKGEVFSLTLREWGNNVKQLVFHVEQENKNKTID